MALSRFENLYCSKRPHVICARRGASWGFEFAAALVLGRELDESTRDRMSEHYAAVMNAFFTIPVSCVQA